VNRRLRIVPKAEYNVEFQFDLSLLSGELNLFHRPFFSLGNSQRQEFTTEKLESLVASTSLKIRRDIDRHDELKRRLGAIGDEISQANSARVTTAQRNAVLSRLLQERKSSISGIERLSRSIPTTQEALEALENYAKLAERLHLVTEVEVRITALGEHGEIPLWLGTMPVTVAPEASAPRRSAS